ncbi:hypothetical protein [Pseudoalteromonas luteoviolacea]|uniref:Uncharacterized protein n=1 Tax=Pseudoalteromonas luteoviolacea S4054 TaxID=1129367 RepID=A0A0F6A7J3_9GAMM|nr:hypothetical protein [Pseudoalteromonas luteoviolacea]AOT10884.1 hypothetical protein S4054249_23865 [Pseudoalteromonas luteoviolacea]AOT15953.1 hypothetical protein S40542_24645 [Pseudoalteromonas luteoviolacea]AOT20705.1 hypothetical protein S4054_23785 [Pseudoalteromonas luteoviolacea]KKE81806.1 hypothetical protein N479_02270 [Pseudoalteromonas luteoviolacea S4054]KZN66236.1 hypothetical protein N481_24810 [Pseudoalteromonas luteoviolacea S4047-1]
MKLIHALAAGVLATFNAHALETIYDADSNAGKLTQYQYGPVQSILMQSASSHYFTAFFDAANQATCTEAALFDEISGTLLTHLTVADNKVIFGAVEQGKETSAKVIKLTCHDNNRSYLVHHKVPAAPSINFDRTLQFDNWQDGGRYPGYYQSVTMDIQLSVNTSAPDGECRLVKFGNGDVPGVFNGQVSVRNIHSDVFTHSGKALYDAFSSSLTYAIRCENSGGTTMLFDEWRITQDVQQGELSISYY